ncbi:hypothetical protein OIU85_006889 [Salix viminalis]|uniref:Vacuolar protein-sorting-associated protein 36 n=1 Tax=Salix viminalis TaxID=40686 RepID=A0A9Q0PLV9_SALVM|nr:hypothetical protein OIU85_006889 [Salix viminalis]
MHSRSVMVSLVIRWKGGIDDFLTKFWDCWKGRAWEIGNDNGGGSGYGSFSGSSGGLYYSDGSLSLMGVAGILRKEKEMWESTDKSMQEAFQDLNALMTINKRVCRCHVSSTTVLSDFVRIPLEKAGGMINLIDVYCLFNRARGTELISPEDLLQACSLWEKFDVIVLCVDSPVMLRKFDSGAIFIQNKSHSDEEIEVFARIKNLVSKPEALWTGINASDAAMTMGYCFSHGQETSLTAESERDISPDGFCFFINLFPEINSDDVHRVKDHGIYSLWIKKVGNYFCSEI